MKIEIAKREQVKIKLGIQGPSGAGKFQGALLIAFGLTNDWSKIAVIDTEGKSSSLYSHLGQFNLIDFKPPYSPERYCEAIDICLKAGMEAIIIDSVTPEWEYILESHSLLTGNSYTNWSKFTPRHQKFISKILQSEAHFICGIRSKQDYVLAEKNGKMIPEKVGMKGIQRDGIDYEFTILFEVNINHLSKATKDRTGLFSERPEFLISKETGIEILNWCKSGELAVIDYESIIKGCGTIEELKNLYESISKQIQLEFLEEFTNKKKQLETLKFNQNGITTH